MPSSYKNFIIDAFDKFSHSDTAAARWETANQLVQTLDGNALNIGALEVSTNRPLWMLSSMSKAWLQKYTDDKLFEIDPFIPHLMKTDKPIALDTSQTVKDQPLNEMLREAGYRFLYGIPFSGARAGERQIVTYCSGLPYADFKEGVRLNYIRMLAAILVTQFSSNDKRDTKVVEYFGRSQLTPREKETLTWLAHGLRNDRIAEQMGISEVMVRKHILSARKKLGASTREQALSIALHRELINL